MQHKIFASALLGFFLLVSVGCGNSDSKFAKVEGTVTYKGEAVSGAIVTFMAVDPNGISGSGGTDASGKYTLNSPGAVKEGAGVLPGEYVVMIQKEEVTYILGQNTKDFQAGKIPEEEYEKRGGSDGDRAETKDLLPVQYRRPNSPLKATVSKGDTKHNFDLTD
jgi:hypothetical protein